MVRDILEWKSSREYFYWRVRRRLAEKKVRDMFHAADPSKTYGEVTSAMQVRRMEPNSSARFLFFYFPSVS